SRRLETISLILSPSTRDGWSSVLRHSSAGLDASCTLPSEHTLRISTSAIAYSTRCLLETIIPPENSSVCFRHDRTHVVSRNRDMIGYMIFRFAFHQIQIKFAAHQPLGYQDRKTRNWTNGNLKSEIVDCTVQFKVSDFGFEISVCPISNFQFGSFAACSF